MEEKAEGKLSNPRSPGKWWLTVVLTWTFLHVSMDEKGEICPMWAPASVERPALYPGRRLYRVTKLAAVFFKFYVVVFCVPDECLLLLC